jgi:hypothetical protein
MPFNREAATAYARKWALSTNPDYPRFDNDCTNFVSQCMLAGGWAMVGEHSYSNRKPDHVWWYGGSLLTRASYTWAGAQNFYNFLSISKRGRLVSDPTGLDRGDVVQMAEDGHVHHSMFVVQKTGSDLLLCYHTDDHLDEPLSAIRQRSPDEVYYYWKIEESSS